MRTGKILFEGHLTNTFGHGAFCFGHAAHAVCSWGVLFWSCGPCRLVMGMVSQAQGGAQPNISQIKIKNLQIPFPSLSVQKEIVAKLDAAKERCEKLKAKAERGLRDAENLRKAILSEAFE